MKRNMLQKMCLCSTTRSSVSESVSSSEGQEGCSGLGSDPSGWTESADERWQKREVGQDKDDPDVVVLDVECANLIKNGISNGMR